jgi:hypothetical protein
MAKANEDWRVLRHGPVERLEPNLWCVTGTLPGMALKRIVVSHHIAITDQPAEVLRRVAATI